MPISFSIEPTNHCNLKCPECPSGLGTLTRPLGLLKEDKFKLLIDQICGTGFYVQLYFQGEPYINKQLPELIDYAQSKNMYVSISTNGTLIDEKNVDKILSKAPDKMIFSIDGLDEETYQNYRIGGTFKDADKGLKLITKRKKELGLSKPFVELQFIVMKQNEHQIDDIFLYGEESGVDKVTLKTMQVSSVENAKYFLPKNEKFRRYIFDDSELKMKGEIKNHCFALWRTSVITWDGRAVPCCFDKDSENTLGIINEKNFSDVWFGKEFNDFRNRVLDNRKKVSMCTNCTEGINMNILEIEN